MDDQGEGNAAPSGRWTCEACGCNTNTEADTACTICGTSNSGPSALRRQARPNWFHRSVFGRGRGLPEEFGAAEEEADLWESVVDDVEMAADQEDRAGNAIESLAMEVSGMANAARRSLESRRQGIESGRQRLLDAARAFSQQPNRPQSSPEELWQVATQNGPNFIPQWMNPSQMAGRNRSTNGIQVVPGQPSQQLAHVPAGAGEGRAIRATQPIPRDNPLSRSSPRRSSSAQAETGGNGVDAEPAPKRVFGFRVAFDHPDCETGGNLGGCYLVGVTVPSFTTYGEQNGLSQSGFFWGIEDGGNKYEGARYAQPNRGSRRLSGSYGSGVSSQDVPMNESNLLFGSREVVSVVVDLDARTLTFWRNDTLLGTLVSNLPRSGNLFPVAVPFNSGVAVAITSLDGDPLPILSGFSQDARRLQKEKEDSIRRVVSERRQILFKDGSITPKLREVLAEIFALYAEDAPVASHSSSARLFYRCGMKLEYLDSITEGNGVSQDKFCEIVEKVLVEDEAALQNRSFPGDKSIRKGDKVELVEGYDKYEDASGGPLKPGDRGTVVEVQDGPNGESRRSIRVLYNGRRWWYQPQAIVSERSGLIDSSGIWFLACLLRAHGYEHSSLEKLNGKPVDESITQVGDVVAPAEKDVSYDTEHGPCVGLVAVDAPLSASASSGDNNTVCVEFVNPSFGAAVGVPRGLSSGSAHVDRRRVRTNKLVFSSVSFEKSDVNMEDKSGDFSIDDSDISAEPAGHTTSDKIRADLAGVARLESAATENILKECKKSPEALAAMFSSGLPALILAAADVARRQMNSLEPREDLPERIAALSSLTLFTADQLFSGSPRKYDAESGHSDEPKQQISQEPSDNLPPGSNAGGQNAGSSRRPSNVRGLVASIQQRRSFLLSLMSRGSARHPHAQGLAAMEAAAMGNGSGSYLPPVYAGGESSTSNNRNEEQHSGAPWEGGEQMGNEGNEDDAVGEEEINMGPADQNKEVPFLETIRRKRGFVSSKSRARTAGMAQLLFQRRVFEQGLLANSFVWTKALIEDFGSKSSIKQSSLLRHALDEDGKSALFLALAFGCSTDIIKCLLASGAQFGPEEIRRCIAANQHEVLALLLRHGPVPDNFDPGECSDEISAVIANAKKRQDAMDRQMRDSAGSFMVEMVRRLLKLALQARRHRGPRLDLCSRVISELLVGNVLLQALHEAQKDSKKAPADSQASEEDVQPDESLSIHPTGLLNSLPPSVLSDALFDNAENATSFFLLLEDYLCSKELPYAAAGLTALACALKHFPQLRSSSEMKRYGMQYLAEYHEELASNRCAEILSRQLTKRLEVSCPPCGDNQSTSSADEREHLSSGTVMCPHGHRALLHVTKHSSFRCDLCGCGVDRGRPMHGCRECDWDACEDCTDLAESGLLKCSTIRELAMECKKLLSNDSPEEAPERVGIDISAAITELSSVSGSTDLTEIASALTRHDNDAAEELARLLRTPGRVTIHQFLDVVLPSIHVACLGHPVESQSTGHRSKKAKVGTGFFDEDKDVSSFSSSKRSQYNITLVNMLILEHGEKAAKLESPSGKSQEMEEDERNVEGESVLLGASQTGPSVSGKEISFYAESSELLRRLQQVLSLNERVVDVPPKRKSPNSGSGNDLQQLISPIDLELLPSSFGDPVPCARNRLIVKAEPLLPLSELEQLVLRGSVPLDPNYLAFCRSLAADKAVILERPRKSAEAWSLAQISCFDEEAGTHGIIYASGCTQSLLRIHHGAADISDVVSFDPKLLHVALAARDYVVVHRNKNGKAQSTARGSFPKDEGEVSQHVGSRAEINEGGKWEPATIVKIEGEGSQTKFTAVSDEGIAFAGIPITSLRAPGLVMREVAEEDGDSGEAGDGNGRGGASAESLVRSFPFFAARARSDESRDPDQVQKTATSLKRSWSALSLVETLSPFELVSSGQSEDRGGETASFSSKIGGSDVEVVPDIECIEMPQKLGVRFNIHPKLPGIEFEQSGGNSEETTLARALHTINERRQDLSGFRLSGKHKLFFTIALIQTLPLAGGLSPLGSHKADGATAAEQKMAVDGEKLVSNWETSNVPQEPARRTRPLSGQTASDESEPAGGLCDGLNDACVQCMEVINCLSEASGYNASARDRNSKGSAFANDVLSKKLVAHLDDPVAVVAGVLPEWCMKAPSFAPRVFNYEARKALLDRAAFGVSRSTFRQQESKIQVGKLRQRMASLRGRAVELVGEAFSGGADDPTALQLQADELYGMEEALASRVRAMFRSAGWQEHSLQVAKAAVRREHLLTDADKVIDQYATDRRVTRRRLEVRFDGESGFDAASGDEAGVTRGFYADVAEALLSSDTVAGVHCSEVCSQDSKAENETVPMEIDDKVGENTQLPLWIPDMESGVVIPTPRANERSDPGIFPRPLPRWHPKMDELKQRFRFMGRLFAAAMRDGFMFPLPLSSSFLKLVQHGVAVGQAVEKGHDLAGADHPVLTSTDLPRPGFLGGEIYAADAHICRALDKLDAADPPLPRPELLRKYNELASDKNFARVAFGKAYDCSFDEYFQDKTFVDPLDPAQDENAAPLCPKGHQKTVTVFNVREWVDLAKRFFLHDGVIAQAEAFRHGVDDFFPSRYLLLFTAEELQHDVCGVGDNVEEWDESAVRKIFKLDGGKGAHEALVAVAAMGGEGGAALSRRFGPSSPTISYLVKALLEATPKQRRQFLSFVTSVPIVTPGRIEVVPIVSPSGDFLPMRDPGCLPRANTCARRIFLPKFEDYDSFSKVLWAVVQEESKFKGFYEWRG